MKIGEYKQAMSHMLKKDSSLENFTFDPNAKLIDNDSIGYATGGRVGLAKGTDPENYIEGALRPFGDTERRVRRSQVKWLDNIKPMLKEYQETKNLGALVGTNKNPSTFNTLASFKNATAPYLKQLSKEIDIPVNELSKIKNSLNKMTPEDKYKYVTERSQSAKKENYINKDPVGQRLNWIANNGKNYSDPNKMIDAYKKQFKVKNLSNDDLFKNPNNRIHLNNIDNLTSHSVGPNDRMFYTPNYSEEEIFKTSILQNNPEVQNKFKNVFKNIYDNFDTYKNKSIKSLPNKIKDGNLLKQFDFIEPTEVKGVPGGKLSGIGQGPVRDSLIKNAGINPDHLTAFSDIRHDSGTVESLLRKLKNLNSTELKDWNLTPTQAKKVSSQLNNFLSGQKDVQSLIKDINFELGNKTFADIYGGVNFEHILSKAAAKDLDYLPKDYLLRGQFATRNFNMFKRDAFDFPIINMMQEYEKNPTKEQATKIQNFIDEFNSKTNDYANFKLNPKTKQLEYLENKPTFDLSRYQEPGTAQNELLSNLKLGASEELQKGFAESKYASHLKGLKLTPEIKSALNNLGLNNSETDALFKINNSLSSGLNPETVKTLFPEAYDMAKVALEKTGPILGKTLTTLFSPAITALSETGALGALENKLTGTDYLEGTLPRQIKEEKSVKDIITNPETYLPYAFMSNAAEIANPALRTALTLGIPETALGIISRAGLAGTAAAGTYQIGKAIKDEYERISNLSPEELEAEKSVKQPEQYYIPEAAGQYTGYANGGRVGFQLGGSSNFLKMLRNISDSILEIKNSTHMLGSTAKSKGIAKAAEEALAPFAGGFKGNKHETLLEKIQNAKEHLPKEYHGILDEMKSYADQHAYDTVDDMAQALDKVIDPNLKFESLPKHMFPMEDPLNDAFIIMDPERNHMTSRYINSVRIDPETGRGTREIFDTFDSETRTFLKKEDWKPVGVESIEKGKEGLN